MRRKLAPCQFAGFFLYQNPCKNARFLISQFFIFFFFLLLVFHITKLVKMQGKKAFHSIFYQKKLNKNFISQCHTLFFNYEFTVLLRESGRNEIVLYLCSSVQVASIICFSIASSLSVASFTQLENSISSCFIKCALFVLICTSSKYYLDYHCSLA